MCIVKIPISQADSDNYPPVCMACLKEDDLKNVRQEFVWNPHGKWAGLLFLALIVIDRFIDSDYFDFMFIALFVLMLVSWFLTRKQFVNLLLCPDCNEKFLFPYKLIKKIGIPFFAAAVALVIFSFKTSYVFYVFFALIILQNLIVYFVRKKYSLIKLIRIDRENVELELPNDDYCQIYENHMSEIQNTSSGQCSKCGAENPQSSRFCEKCGASL